MISCLDHWQYRVKISTIKAIDIPGFRFYKGYLKITKSKLDHDLTAEQGTKPVQPIIRKEHLIA